MPGQYIVVEGGFPEVAPSLPEIKDATAFALTTRFWEHYFAFDADTKYRLVVPHLPHLPHLSLFRRLLNRVFLGSPLLGFESAWEACGDYDQKELIELVRDGLKEDDDIIQQWFDGDEVIRLLETATSFDEVVVAVRAICGEHETDDHVLAYVRRALGEDWPS